MFQKQKDLVMDLQQKYLDIEKQCLDKRAVQASQSQLGANKLSLSPNQS